MTVPIGPTPTPAPAAPAAPPQADPALLEQTRSQVLNEIFDGKYKSVADAKKGYWEGNKYIGQLESLVSSGPAATATQPDPFKRLAEESLIPMDAFQQSVQMLVGAELQKVFGPISGALQGREQLIAQNPKYATDEAAVLGFANSHPELQQKVQAMTAAGFPKEALTLQYMEYLQNNPPVSTPPADPKGGLPGAPGSAPNRSPGTQEAAEAAQQRLLAAVRHALATKDESALWNEVYKDFTPKLPPGFLPSNG